MGYTIRGQTSLVTYLVEPSYGWLILDTRKVWKDKSLAGIGKVDVGQNVHYLTNLSLKIELNC